MAGKLLKVELAHQVATAVEGLVAIKRIMEAMDEQELQQEFLELADSKPDCNRHGKVHLVEGMDIDVPHNLDEDIIRGSQNHNYCKKLVKSQIFHLYCQLYSNQIY